MAEYSDTINTVIDSYSESRKSYIKDQFLSSPGDINSLLLGGSRISSEEITQLVVENSQGVSTLRRAQERVRESISGDDAGSVFLTSLLITIFGIANSTSRDVQRAADISENIADMLDNPPENYTNEQQEEALDAILAEAEQIQNRIARINGGLRADESDTSKLQMRTSGFTLLNSIISDFDIDQNDFEGGPLVVGPGEGQTVITTRSMGDRFYTEVDPDNSTRIGITELSSIFTLEDSEGNSFSGLSGYDTYEIDGDQITLKPSPESSADEITLTIVNPPGLGISRSSLRSKTPPSLIEDARTIKESLSKRIQSLSEEEFGFEIQACLILDLLSILHQISSRIIKSIESMIAKLKFSNDIVTGGKFGRIPNIGLSILQGIPGISGIMDAILNPSDAAIQFLGIRNSFINPGSFLAGSSAVCGFNKAKYCDLSSTLTRMIKNLLFDLDMASLSLGNLDIDSISFDISGLLDFLNKPFNFLRKQINKIKEGIADFEKSVCTFISKRLKGRPKAVTGFRGLMLGMIPALSAALLASSTMTLGGTSGNQSNTINEVADDLERNGLDRAAQTLRDGDISTFLAMRETNSTFTGSIQDTLVDLEYNNTVDFVARSYANELKPVVKEIDHEQKSTSTFMDRQIIAAENRKSSYELDTKLRTQWIKRSAELVS